MGTLSVSLHVAEFLSKQHRAWQLTVQMPAAEGAEAWGGRRAMGSDLTRKPPGGLCKSCGVKMGPHSFSTGHLTKIKAK